MLSTGATYQYILRRIRQNVCAHCSTQKGQVSVAIARVENSTLGAHVTKTMFRFRCNRFRAAKMCRTSDSVTVDWLIAEGENPVFLSLPPREPNRRFYTPSPLITIPTLHDAPAFCKRRDLAYDCECRSRETRAPRFGVDFARTRRETTVHRSSS